MTIKSRQQKKKSLCEKSVHLVKNIIKLSSLSLASTNLGQTGNKSIATRPSQTILSVDVLPVSDHPRINQRSQKPEQNKSNIPRSYLLDGSDGRGESSSTYIVIQGIDNAKKKFQERNRHDELNASITNLRASDYIRRFHEKNDKVDSTTGDSEDLPFMLPPPPPIIKLAS